ncbi:MAG: c-type cytochrome [Acidobacteriales bacterium]|nr:c-type cytochrome [Terriglobales bacterium]
MKRAVVIFFAVVAVIGIGALVFLKVAASGFSAKAEPTAIEKFVARSARRLAAPSSLKSRQNPMPNNDEVLSDARAHWADHCASCHANNGSGDTEMGRNMYPRAPDMRKSDTQDLSDGELFFIIENGIRLTGMPAWGAGTAKSEEDSWKLVRFIRHLPQLSDDEEQEMKKMNPKTPAELGEEKEVEEFLKGEKPNVQQHSQH